jgi:gluconate 2-dehydrogenase gamma chain
MLQQSPISGKAALCKSRQIDALDSRFILDALVRKAYSPGCSPCSSYPCDTPSLGENMPFDRRRFLFASGAGLGAAWFSANWSLALAAGKHARQAAASAVPPKFEFFTAAQATEIAAICARIIPSDDSPGATEAGAVYFTDRMLCTVAARQQSIFREGLPAFQEDFLAMFPAAGKFSAASVEQQDQFLHSIADEGVKPRRPNRPGNPGDPSFFEALRAATIAAFLIDPESEYAANRTGVGWQLIGRDPAHSFHSPFGFYDRDYPGWSPPSSSGKAK